MIIDTTYQDPIGRNETGGKAFHLLQLARQGYPVPEFIVLPASFLREDDQCALVKKLEALLPALADRFGQASSLAVRSSAVAEDSEDLSFAGQFKSLLNVSLHQVPAAILEVLASANEKRLEVYGPGAQPGGMAVIVQRMVPATASGVAFGINPLTGNEAQLMVNAVTGLADQLVSGNKNADCYVVEEGAISKQTLNGQAVLGDEMIRTVAHSLNSLNRFYGRPQDIEFAFSGNRFYLLQSRPVTAVRKGRKIIWDNSNIVESYPGLTLPLSFSFISKMYEAVYRQFSLLLGVPRNKIGRHGDVYANMLGLLNGRVYYNLNSWFKALSLLPGYRINAAFMEKMMGVKEKFDLDVTEKKKAGLKDYGELIYALGCMLKNLFTVKKQRRRFIRDFDQVYGQFSNKDYHSCSIKEIWLDYQLFERLMLARWKAPLVNDFFAMIYFGLLHKLCIKYCPEEKDLHNKLIASSKDIVTTEPLRRIPGLVQLISENASLKNFFLNHDAATAWQELHQPGNEACLEAVQAYLADWGERCVAELKLETITYSQEPERLIAVLQSYLKNGWQHHQAGTMENERLQAEQTIRSAIKSPIKRILFNHVLRQARYLVSNRENLRYYRTKGFSMVRNMMLALGEQLQRKGLIGCPRDIFYLKLSEISTMVSDNNDHPFMPLVEERKKQYGLYEDLPLPERLISYGQPDDLILYPQSHTNARVSGGELRGIPCSPGTVKARVKLLHQASELESLDRQIMATYATDPGWVVLFPSAKGILTERGSLLSHAAIVSREMGIPCIVGIEGLMQLLKDGDEIIMDGSTGIVKILNRLP